MPGYKRLRNFLRIAPRGFEPLNGNPQLTNNKTLTENTNPVLSTSLDKTLQKYPELREIVKVWSELPEHTRTEITGLVERHTTEGKADGGKKEKS
ncbi:MAG: hypothetical protein IIB56_18985 [Planctomycetes bacterium]|nr:hypothetical protein [Planctomycetota bacterium]